MSSSSSGIAKKSLFLLSYHIFGGMIGYIAMFFALRFAGQEAWGIYGSAMGIVGLLSIITSLGVDEAHIKKANQKNDKEACKGAYLLIKSALEMIFIIVSIGGFYILGTLMGYKFESKYLEIAVYVTILTMIINGFKVFFKTVYQSELNAKKSVFPMFIQTAVQNTMITVFSIYYGITHAFNGNFMGVLFSYSYLIGSFSALITYIAWEFNKNFKIKMPDSKLVKEYVSFSIPLAFMGIVGTIQAYTDRTMLQFFWNSAEVGGYFTAQKISLALVYLGTSVSFFLYPAQSKLYEKENKEMFYRITAKSERYLSLLSLPIVLFTVVMAKEILNLFNRSMINYSIPLIILMFYAYFNLINRPYSSQMTSANKPKEVLKVGVLQATINVVLNTIFIPSSIMGIPLLGLKSTGAALATLISFLIGFAYLRFKVWKILGTKFKRHNIYHLISAAIAMTALYGLKIFLGAMYQWYMIGFAFILFFAIYLPILYALKEIKEEDFELVKKIIKRQ